MLAADSPFLLIVHAYTQHMALLAGGQILRRSVRGALQLGPDDPGTAIFEFQVWQRLTPLQPTSRVSTAVGKASVELWTGAYRSLSRS